MGLVRPVRITLLLTVTTLLLMLAHSPIQGLPRSVVDQIIQEDYRKLTKRETSPDKLFGQAYVATRRGQLIRADRLFRRLIDHYPDSSRSLDARYFLNLLKVSREQSLVPDVEVRLAEGPNLSGTITSKAKVKTESGTKLATLKPDEKWTISADANGHLTFRKISQTESRSVSSSLLIVPVNEGPHLVYDRTRYRGQFKFHLRKGGNLTLVNKLPLNHYLFGVVRKEIAPDWPASVLKAQAVAARSFALIKMKKNNGMYDVQSSEISQAYGGYQAETSRTRKAVERTLGEVLTYKNRVVPAYFHANSGGYIETAKSIWDGSRTPYIVPKGDTWSLDTSYSTWKAELTYDRLNQLLSSNSLAPVGSPPRFRRADTLPSGRTKTLSYWTSKGNRTVVDANAFRLAIGTETLKSTWFKRFHETSGGITIRGRGWGHGVGMSQWGARAMAMNGHSYSRILRFYYPKARIMERYGLGSSSKAVLHRE